MSRELPLIPLNVFDLIDSEGAEGWYLIMSRKDEYYGSYRANFREVKREIFSDIPKQMWQGFWTKIIHSPLRI